MHYIESWVHGSTSILFYYVKSPVLDIRSEVAAGKFSYKATRLERSPQMYHNVNIILFSSYISSSFYSFWETAYSSDSPLVLCWHMSPPCSLLKFQIDWILISSSVVIAATLHQVPSNHLPLVEKGWRVHLYHPSQATLSRREPCSAKPCRNC